jgi:hypothetical protein
MIKDELCPNNISIVHDELARGFCQLQDLTSSVGGLLALHDKIWLFPFCNLGGIWVTNSIQIIPERVKMGILLIRIKFSTFMPLFNGTWASNAKATDLWTIIEEIWVIGEILLLIYLWYGILRRLLDVELVIRLIIFLNINNIWLSYISLLPS